MSEEAEAGGGPRSTVRVSLIVPIKDELDFLPKTLPSFERSVEACEAGELILVDNGSKDGSKDFLQTNASPETTVLSLQCGTIGAVRNYGAAKARGYVLAFVDADVVIDPGHLRKMSVILQSSSAAVIGARVGPARDSSKIALAWEELHARARASSAKYVNTGNMAVKREVFEEIGGFSEQLETGEDAEFCQRVRLAGHEVMECPELSAVHLDTPNSMKEFFKKEVWHGLGAIGTMKREIRDWPTLAAVCNGLWSMLLIVVVVGLLTGGTITWSRILGAVGIASTALFPAAASVIYRIHQGGTVKSVLRAVALYELYLWGRLVGLVVYFGSELGRATGRS